MGNNKEIRQRMEICRYVLIALVWIFGIAEMIGGIVMINYSYYDLRPYGIAVVIVSILGSIIGHFLVNVALAIPFILLNNGDILESMKGNVDDWVCKNCSYTNRKTALFCNNCGEKK